MSKALACWTTRHFYFTWAVAIAAIATNTKKERNREKEWKKMKKRWSRKIWSFQFASACITQSHFFWNVVSFNVESHDTHLRHEHLIPVVDTHYKIATNTKWWIRPDFAPSQNLRTPQWQTSLHVIYKH